MRATATDGPPDILIVDDQFGRCELGPAFRAAVSAEAWAVYEADRANLCGLYRLADGDSRAVDDPIARVTFCAGQRWDADSSRIVNDAESVCRAVARGWPFRDGRHWALVLLDLRFVAGALDSYGDPHDGSQFGSEVLLPLLRSRFGDDLPIVVLSSTPREDANLKVRELGALDYIQRLPPSSGRAPYVHLAAVLQRHGLMPDPKHEVEGRSLAVLKILRQARRAAASARNILLIGETGSGKGALAGYIHRTSNRFAAPLVVYHAAHRPAELQADELFGHWRGAFTGAVGDAPGVWERANHGMLFIDEVADIDVTVQQKLMQPIDERVVSRLGRPPRGEAETTQLDVVVILATNRDLRSSASIKLDFLNRINAYTIEVPPLRSRVDDLPAIVERLCTRIAPDWQGTITREAMHVLAMHDWREGNVRELRNVLERALINNPRQDITASDIAQPAAQPLEPAAEAAQTTLLIRKRQEFLMAIAMAPSDMPASQAHELRTRYAGYFAELLADILRWSFEIERNGGRVNPTATVRFLLGRRDISTLEAKQFLRKLLTLDTRGRSVAAFFLDYARETAHPTVVRIAEDAVAKQAPGGGEREER